MERKEEKIYFALQIGALVSEAQYQVRINTQQTVLLFRNNARWGRRIRQNVQAVYSYAKFISN